MKHPEFTLSQYTTAEELYKAKSKYYQDLVTGYEAVAGDPFGDVYVVVTERDHDDPIKSRGSICMETYTGSANLPNAVDFAKRIDGRYGKAIICKLEKVGDVGVCEKLINDSQ